MTQSLESIFYGFENIWIVLVMVIVVSFIIAIVLKYIPKETLKKWEKEQKKEKPKPRTLQEWIIDIIGGVLVLGVIILLGVIVLNKLSEVMVEGCANCTTVLS